MKAVLGPVCSHHAPSTSWALCTASIFLTIFSLSCKTAPWVRSIACLRGWDFMLCVLFPSSKPVGSCWRPREGRDGGEAIRLEPGKSPCPSSPCDPGQATFLLFCRGPQVRANSLSVYKAGRGPSSGQSFLGTADWWMCLVQQHASVSVQIQHASIQRKQLVNSSIPSTP